MMPFSCENERSPSPEAEKLRFGGVFWWKIGGTKIASAPDMPMLRLFGSIFAVGILFLPSCWSGGASGTSINGAGSGKADLILERVEWGRMVDILDSTGALVAEDVVIREGLQTDGVNFTLGLNPLTQTGLLTIHHVFLGELGYMGGLGLDTYFFRIPFPSALLKISCLGT